MPRLLPRHYAKILYEITTGVDQKNLDKAVALFLEFVQRRHELRKIDRIRQEFETYAKERSGVKEITITTARPLGKKIIENIARQFGEAVEATEAVDGALIGGVVVRAKNTILDASVRTELVQLKQKLIT